MRNERQLVADRLTAVQLILHQRGHIDEQFLIPDRCHALVSTLNLDSDTTIVIDRQTGHSIFRKREKVPDHEHALIFRWAEKWAVDLQWQFGLVGV